MNTFVPNSTILSAAVNQNFTDIATGLSDCLTRDNQAGMTQIFRAVSGSVSAPGITFNSDTTSGLYLSATGVVGLVAKSLGLLVNSSVYQVSSAAVQAGGSGYAIGDTITLTGGTAITQSVLTVATLSGSAVATVTATYGGNYTVKPSDPVAQGSTSGSGSGATFNITWTTQYTRSAVTNEAGAVPWSRLGSSAFVSGLMSKATAYDFLRTIATIGSGLSISTATSPPTITTTTNPTLIPNYLSGLTMSTAGGSGTMSIAAGVANDSTNTVLMNLSSAISKTTASWAVGSGNGGLDTGSIANSTWYHFYEIYRPDTQVVDVVFSTNATTPTLPTNYTLYRRIGSGKTDSSAQWTAFTQFGDDFLWSSPVQDFSTTNPGTSAILQAINTPLGVNVKAFMNFHIAWVASAGVPYLSSPSQADLAPSTSATPFLDFGAGNITNPLNFATRGIWTDTSSRIRYRITASDANTVVAVATTMWTDRRGK